MKRAIIKLISIVLCAIVSLNLSAQNILIDYQSWNPASPPCNLFANATNVPATMIGSSTSINVEHQTKLGQPKYTSQSIELECIFSSTFYGTRYRLSYSFKQGYGYKITVTAAKLTSAAVPYLRLDINNNGGGGNTSCTGTQIINGDFSGNPAPKQITGLNFADYEYVFSSLNNNFSTLEVASIPPNNGTTNSVVIRKIQIEEIPPPPTFTLPATTSISCGSTTPITFTITNVYSSPGVTDYTWNLGATPNNWLLSNGSPAPATYSTGTTNTLALTPVCGTTPKNISATATIGSNTYQTNTDAVTITNPILSISGNANVCSGTTPTYTINNLPCNTTVNWSVSPAGIASLSCSSCNSTTLDPTGNGSVTLSATVSGGCTPSTPLSYPIYVGNATIEGVLTDFIMIHCNVVRYKWTVVSEGANSFKWYYRNLPGGTFTLFKTSSDDWAASPDNDGSCDSIEVKVEAINSCNPSSPTSYTFFSDKCTPFVAEDCTYGRSVAISPNPVTSSAKLEIKDDPNSTEVKRSKQIQEVRIVDKQGMIKKIISGNYQQSMIINLSELNTDIYSVLVYDGKLWLSVSLLKQ